MKSLFEYVNESKTPNWKKIYKQLNDKDRRELDLLASEGPGTIRTMEEMEQLFWRGQLKDKVEEYWALVNRWIEGICTIDDITYSYSLARSGKQNKIEVIATVFYMLKNMVWV